MQTFLSFHNGVLQTEIAFSDAITFSHDNAASLFTFDSNTEPLFLKLIRPAAYLTVEAGEPSKNLASVQQIVQAALDQKLTRNAVFYAVGGGVVCDTVGFAASIFKRGARLVLLPTTLLAMVDAAIGGKTAVDFGGAKNSLGSFYPAEKVLVCFDTLRTLPKAEFKNGLAEIIKIGMINEKKLFQLIMREPPERFFTPTAILKEAIFMSIAGKTKIVEKDFHEQNIRMFLNLGHTFAHALEALTAFNFISHGEAVGWGIAQELNLGVQLGLTDAAYAEMITALLKRFGYMTDLFDMRLLSQVNMSRRQFCSALVQAMQNDKKNITGGEITFSLQKQLGSTVIVPVPRERLQTLLAERLKIF